MAEFVHEATRGSENKDELEVLFYTLMAMSLNIRFQDMGKTTHITSTQMANTKQYVCLLSLSN